MATKTEQDAQESSSEAASFQVVSVSNKIVVISNLTEYRPGQALLTLKILAIGPRAKNGRMCSSLASKPRFRRWRL